MYILNETNRFFHFTSKKLVKTKNKKKVFTLNLHGVWPQTIGPHWALESNGAPPAIKLLLNDLCGEWIVTLFQYRIFSRAAD